LIGPLFLRNALMGFAAGCCWLLLRKPERRKGPLHTRLKGAPERDAKPIPVWPGQRTAAAESQPQVPQLQCASIQASTSPSTENLTPTLHPRHSAAPRESTPPTTVHSTIAPAIDEERARHNWRSRANFHEVALHCGWGGQKNSAMRQ
jgi:hypothetical protein